MAALSPAQTIIQQGLAGYHENGERSPQEEACPTPGFINDPPSDIPTSARSPSTPRTHTPKKASISSMNTFTTDPSSYFNPLGLSRANSIYSLSRASLSSQLATLTAMQLPDASELSASMSAIPTSAAAARALMNAADQMKVWISTADRVLSGLNAEDDVEWASAAGKEGIDHADFAIGLFDSLIDVYTKAIEELQNRSDIGTVNPSDMVVVVQQMEIIVSSWTKIQATLVDVKRQVEAAIEWEELWTVVLGDIDAEIRELSTLVFELEDKRHSSPHQERVEDAGDNMTLAELNTIAGENSVRSSGLSDFTLSNGVSTSQSPLAHAFNDEQTPTSLFALLARLQPLRASLDFLPMRLADFLGRSSSVFPTACEELRSRRVELERQFDKLEQDAECLKRELDDDKWVLVFRNAGRQAQKMCESVGRSITKLREALEPGYFQHNPAQLGDKVKSYQAKRQHYGPAIERMLNLIGQTAKDRQTVHGEVVRIHDDMRRRWESLQMEMRDTDRMLIEYPAKAQQLRDSISSIISMEQHTDIASNETPGSSPPSSVVAPAPKPVESSGVLTPGSSVRSRGISISSYGQPVARKLYGISPAPSTASHIPRRSQSSQISSPTVSTFESRISSPVPNIRTSSIGSTLHHQTPPSGRSTRPSVVKEDNRPRWSSSTNMRGTVIGHNFKPLAVTETPPSHHSSRLGSRSSSVTKIPGPSPLSRASRSSMASSAASAPLTPKHGDYLYITSTPSPLAARSTNRDASDFRPRLRAQVSTPHFSNRLAGGYGSATGGSQRDSMISLDSSPGAEELENMIRSMRPARAAARAVVGLGAGVGAGAGAGTGSGAGVGAGGGSGRARATSVTGRAREGGLSISAGPVMNKAAMLRARAMEVKNERAGKKGGWR